MHWADPTDPDVVAAVLALEESPGLSEEDQALVSRAVAVASEILTLAAGHRVHPAGEITEEYRAWGRRPRFSLLWGPVTAVSSVVQVLGDGTERSVSYLRFGQTVELTGFRNGVQGSLPLWRTNWSTGPADSRWRITYTFADTVTAAARQALLTYAHETYLLLIGNTEDCQLPANVTSITREGLGIELATPQDFLDRGRTGIASIDAWLAQINRYQSARPSQVFTPDAPPGVGTALRRLP